MLTSCEPRTPSHTSRIGRSQLCVVGTKAMLPATFLLHAPHPDLLDDDRHGDLAAADALPAGRRLRLGHGLLEGDVVADLLAVVAPRERRAVAGVALPRRLHRDGHPPRALGGDVEGDRPVLDGAGAGVPDVDLAGVGLGVGAEGAGQLDLAALAVVDGEGQRGARRGGATLAGCGRGGGGDRRDEGGEEGGAEEGGGGADGHVTASIGGLSVTGRDLLPQGLHRVSDD